MSTILVVDDMPIIRDPIASMLDVAGYRTLRAGNGVEAMKVLGAEGADLILLDVSMPEMDGLTFLGRIRSDPSTARIPVIMLSGAEDRNDILRAGKLGIQGYVLKSRFSLTDLLNRVRTQLEPAKVPAHAVAGASGKMAEKAAPVEKAAAAAALGRQRGDQGAAARKLVAGAPGLVPPVSRLDHEMPNLLTRELCLQRTERALQGKTLSGVVAQVISLAASSRGDMAQLASLVSRDAMLSARILQAANSTGYRTARSVVSTIPDAIRQVGCSGVRNIAASLAIFDAMPASSADGFNPILCWQHSFAVATLCERLATVGGGEDDASAHAYLVGLCHDLGEILFRMQFGPEYQTVVDAQAKTGRPRNEVERTVLGMTHGELVLTILKHLGLPDAVRDPIEVFHNGGQARGADAARLVRLLRLAELYANGALLAAGGNAPVEPLTCADCRAATGTDNPPALDIAAFSGEIVAMTAMLARLTAEDEAKLLVPLYPVQEVRLWLARDPALSTFDPVTTALQSMARVTARSALPDVNALRDYDGLVVLARNASVAGFTGRDIATVSSARSDKSPRVLWLVGRMDPADATPAGACPAPWPISLSQLARFVGPA